MCLPDLPRCSDGFNIVRPQPLHSLGLTAGLWRRARASLLTEIFHPKKTWRRQTAKLHRSLGVPAFAMPPRFSLFVFLCYCFSFSGQQKNYVTMVTRPWYDPNTTRLHSVMEHALCHSSLFRLIYPGIGKFSSNSQSKATRNATWIATILRCWSCQEPVVSAHIATKHLARHAFVFGRSRTLSSYSIKVPFDSPAFPLHCPTSPRTLVLVIMLVHQPEYRRSHETKLPPAFRTVSAVGPNP